MSEADADAGNVKEIAYWNGTAGRNWTARQEEWDTVSPRMSPPPRSRAPRSQPGERVVDIGCGCGGTTLELGKRVGPQGRVLGLDISTVMLARAVERTLPGLPINNSSKPMRRFINSLGANSICCSRASAYVLRRSGAQLHPTCGQRCDLADGWPCLLAAAERKSMDDGAAQRHLSPCAAMPKPGPRIRGRTPSPIPSASAGSSAPPDSKQLNSNPSMSISISASGAGSIPRLAAR